MCEQNLKGKVFPDVNGIRCPCGIVGNINRVYLGDSIDFLGDLSR